MGSGIHFSSPPAATRTIFKSNRIAGSSPSKPAVTVTKQLLMPSKRLIRHRPVVISHAYGAITRLDTCSDAAVLLYRQLVNVGFFVISTFGRNPRFLTFVRN